MRDFIENIDFLGSTVGADESFYLRFILYLFQYCYFRSLQDDDDFVLKGLLTNVSNKFSFLSEKPYFKETRR